MVRLPTRTTDNSAQSSDQFLDPPTVYCHAGGKAGGTPQGTNRHRLAPRLIICVRGAIPPLCHAPSRHRTCKVTLPLYHRVQVTASTKFLINSNRSPTRCNNFSVYYPDVYLQLNMFRAFSRPSSGAQRLQ